MAETVAFSPTNRPVPASPYFHIQCPLLPYSPTPLLPYSPTPLLPYFPNYIISVQPDLI
ncbi:MAG: hypothetical protein SWX82_13930 [Cyanobacteriota bacterium]|nr:hypothetical protein [Cyanobacteriota bacterium]